MKNLKKHFKFLGNLPLTEKEQKLQPKDFHSMPSFPSLLTILAPEDVLETCRQEYEDKVKRGVFRYLDEKSDKFFYIEFGGNYIDLGGSAGDVQLFYITGRTGTYVRPSDVEEFDSEKDCDEKAQKLIAAKVKEGYVLATNYYRDNRGKFQFDDGEKAKSRQNKLVATHQALRYTDEKSDKFWRVEYIDNCLVVNYGKVGAIGKYQVKEFDSEDECDGQYPYTHGCTAAAAAMIYALFSQTAMTLGQIVASIDANEGRVENNQSFANLGVWPEHLSRYGFQGFNISDRRRRDAFDGFDSITNELSNGNPLMVITARIESGYTHTMVVTGTANVNGADSVIFHDPHGEGSRHVVPYSDFSNNDGFTFGGQSTVVRWDSTYTTTPNNRTSEGG